MAANGTVGSGEEDAGYDVFLSYNSRDRPAVQRIARALEKGGLRVWADWKMPSGSVWLTEIEKVIRQVRAAAFFVGPSGMGPWHETERQAFHIRNTRIIPVILPGVAADFEPPPFLERLSWIDLRKTGINRKAIDQLSEGIRAAGAGAAGPLPPATLAGAADRPRLRVPLSWRRPLRFAALGLAAVGIAAGGTLAFRAWRAAHPPRRSVAVTASPWRVRVPLPRPSAAVLTFANRSADRGLDWLGTALAEAVSEKLGAGGAVRIANRNEVVQSEGDLLLPPRAEVPPPDLARLRSLLGVDSIVAGGYGPVGGTSAVRLDLAIYDARGRILGQAKETGEAAAWLDLADRAAEGASPETSLRRRLGAAPLTLAEERHFRTLFPLALPAAKLYAEGLERYRHYDTRGAADLLGRAAELAPHPRLLAILALADHLLGRSREAAVALATAERLDRQARGTPAALSAEERRQIEGIEQRIALDRQGVAKSAEARFREFFPDDLVYGLLAMEALVEAGEAGDALRLARELRELPAAQSHPRLACAEGSAYFTEQSYARARAGAERGVREARLVGAVRQEAQAHLLWADALVQTGETPLAEEQIRLARAGFERTGDPAGVAQCVQLRAILYTNLDLATAESLYREALARYEALGSPQAKARVLYSLSTVLRSRGDEAGARDRSREAAELAGTANVSQSEGMAAYDEGAQLYLGGQLRAAQGRYEAARQMFDRLHQRDYYANTLSGLGEIEWAEGKLQNAAELDREALETHEAAGSAEGAAYDNVDVGRVLAATGNYFAARQRYELALRSLKPAEGTQAKEPETLAEALLALGELELRSGKSAEAERQAREAEAVAAGAGLPPFRSRALSLLALSLLDRGKKDEAKKTAAGAAGLAKGDFRAEKEAGIAVARTRAAVGEVGPALASLQALAADSTKAGMVVYELESLLAQGEIELADGRVNPARKRLGELSARAAALGYGEMQKRATAALGG